MPTVKVKKQTIQFDYKRKGSKMFVNPKHLKPNPLNKKIYSNQEEERSTQEEIAESYKTRVENGLTPNEQPIIVYPDGLIDAGHTRWAASKLANVDLWFELSESPYPDFENKPYSTLQIVVGSNIYRKMTPSVKLNEFEEMNKAYAIEKGYARSSKEEDVHLKKLGIGRDTIKKLQEIKREQPTLLTLVDNGEYSIKAAWEEATGRNKVKVVKSNNPNRDWSEIYTNDVFKTIMNRVSNCISQMRDISYKLNGESVNPFNDFVKASVTANISWMMESIGAEVLRGEGHDVKCATGHPTDPDINHLDIDDKVEIKVTNYDGPNTKWKGGQGIREGQYILVAYDEQIERWLVIFTKLTEKDWKSAGQAGHILPIKNVYDNHKKDYEVVYGEVYASNGKLVVQLEKLK